MNVFPTLSIAFFAKKANWLHKVLNSLDKEQKKIYLATACPEIGRSITRKAVMFELIGRDFNRLVKEFNAFLKANQHEVNNCIDKGVLFRLGNEMQEKAYRLILLIETYITGLESYAHFHDTYLSVFYEKVLNSSYQKGNPEWKTALYALRNDFVHNYSSWISFKLEKNGFNPAFTLAESLIRRRNYKKYPHPTITIDEVNEFTREINMYYGIEIMRIVERSSPASRV